MLVMLPYGMPKVVLASADRHAMHAACPVVRLGPPWHQPGAPTLQAAAQHAFPQSFVSIELLSE
jgi:hypothetical protein